MIPKAKRGAAGRKPPRARRRPEPLDVHLTVRFKFGDEPADAVTVMNNRRIPMVNSVFANRDRIVRTFVQLLLRTGLSSPKVAGELAPIVRLLKRGR